MRRRILYEPLADGETIELGVIEFKIESILLEYIK